MPADCTMWATLSRQLEGAECALPRRFLQFFPGRRGFGRGATLLLPSSMAFLAQRRNAAITPRLSSVVRVHLAISASAQINQEKALTSVRPWRSLWYTTCNLPTREGWFDDGVCTRSEALKPELTPLIKNWVRLSPVGKTIMIIPTT